MKTKYEIILALNKAYDEFCNYIIDLNEEQFLNEPHNKWSLGQHTAHLIKSISPVVLAFKIPKTILKLFFAKPNREGRTYSELIKKYNLKLTEGGKASGRFNIKQKIMFYKKDMLLRRLLKNKRNLCKLIERKKENELDTLLLPHPLLGKLTLREMLYFTIYHAEHHLKIVQNEPYI